ncbi:hypothetical protein [Okeania sp. SIO1I7]|nr:hypothetical protein [Okeania sp. SIO1I7]NET27080.1 hypothetical protein [Okeania sp. SIO1I7]
MGEGSGSIYCHASEKLMGGWGDGEMGRWEPTPNPSQENPPLTPPRRTHP